MFRLTTLGAVDLRDAGGNPVESLLAQPKRLALLIYLAGLPAGSSCRRDSLLALFWAESDQERARASLRRTLHFIRHALGAEVLRTRGEDVSLDPVAFTSDLQEFHAARTVEDRTAMVRLHAGEFLPGFHVDSAPGFEEWAATRRAHLLEAALAAAEALARECAESGNSTEALRWARRAVEIGPEEERVVRMLMKMQAAFGDRAGALETYGALESRLTARYGDTPSGLTEGLARDLRSLPADAPAGPALPQAAPPEAPRVAAWRIPAAGLLAAVALLLVGMMRWGSAPPAPEQIQVAVLPFAVSDSALGYLETGFPVLLSARLHGVGPLHSLDPSAAQRAWARAGLEGTPAELGVGEAMRASLVIRGEVTAVGDSLRIVASLWDVRRGAAMARSVATGTEQELQGMADRVATHLLGEYLEDHGDAWAATAARTTTSPAAMKAWLEGEALLRQGRYAPAVEAFQAATEADSTFALGQYRLALAADWAGQGAIVNTAVRRAEALSDRLGPQDRVLVEALYAMRLGHTVAAEKLYREAAVSRPSDAEAWLGLGETLFHRNPAAGRSMQEARPAFEQVLRLDAGNFPALTHLARLAVLRGDLALLDTLTQGALETDPDGGHRAEMLLLRTVSLGDRAAAAEVSTLQVNQATMDALWRAADYTGNPAKLQAQARLLLRGTASPEMRASLYLLLAHLSAAQGCAAGTASAADSLAVMAPVAAEMTRALFRLPPHRFDLPGPSGAEGSGVKVYMGAMQNDRRGRSMEVLEAATALRAGDPGPARLLLPVQTDSGRPRGSAAQVRAYMIARLAREDGIPSAMRALAASDSAAGVWYVQSSPYFPRALSHLAAVELLAAAGRRNAALTRLSGVHEDLGFGIAYLAAAHHRRAGLLAAAGDARGAARAEAEMRRIWRGCPR